MDTCLKWILLKLPNNAQYQETSCVHGAGMWSVGGNGAERGTHLASLWVKVTHNETWKRLQSPLSQRSQDNNVCVCVCKSLSEGVLCASQNTCTQCTLYPCMWRFSVKHNTLDGFKLSLSISLALSHVGKHSRTHMHPRDGPHGESRSILVQVAEHLVCFNQECIVSYGLMGGRRPTVRNRWNRGTEEADMSYTHSFNHIKEIVHWIFNFFNIIPYIILLWNSKEMLNSNKYLTTKFNNKLINLIWCLFVCHGCFSLLHLK